MTRVVGLSVIRARDKGGERWRRIGAVPFRPHPMDSHLR
ncbi:hypothetical protein E9232_003886 [Inquilinus ginsengisoli]|uniref:Uncharacterized protein n=1 Tax=Inquilinus ginsengisoli TaxID=363840 RepID=A0ABU1JUX4_9PROT|nr:hypothetical protein [Inquilinus ginsengisoli]